MILSCPQCNTSFEVPDGALPEDGRKLKCSKCKHIWHQMPIAVDVPEPSAGDELEAPESAGNHDGADDASSEIDVPAEEAADNEPQQSDEGEENVLSESGDENSSSDEAKEDENNGRLKDTLASLYDDEESVDISFDELGDDNITAKKNNPDESLDGTRASNADLIQCSAILFAALLVVTLLIFFVFKNALAKTYPSLMAIYGALGIELSLDVQDIEINNVKALIEYDQKMIAVSGEIMNLSSEKVELLPIMARQIDADGHVLKTWIITPPVKTLDGAGIIPFESKYKLASGASQVDVNFSLLARKMLLKGAKKSGSKAADTNPAKQAEQSHAPSDPHKSHAH